MSRVRRKESPKTHSRVPRNSDQNSEILKRRQIGGVKQLSSSRAKTTFLSSIDAAVEL